MAKTFTSFVQIEKFVQSACTKAIESAANILLEKLQEFIMTEYYDLYTPIFYQRTMQFYQSAVANLISPNTAEIGMDETKMNYGDYWDGETQLYMADAGFHGSANIWRKGFFWKEFVAWCNENAIKILVNELRKNGIQVIKK